MDRGGNGVQRVNNRLSLEQAIESVAQAIVVEYLPGEEITVDCFTDRNRRLIWAGPRTRERVRAGISMRSREVVLDDEITDIVETINARLALRGPWFVQLKRDRTGKWKLLEVACRIAGAMVFQRARGVNLPLMAIHDFMGRDVVALPEMSVGIVDRPLCPEREVNSTISESMSILTTPSLSMVLRYLPSWRFYTRVGRREKPLR
ncbi:carbamoyl phosphate synthase-like protein [Citrobacter koseri]|nr:carbamoyl phosphate synthase-like protein [Citrobacter koseri]